MAKKVVKDLNYRQKTKLRTKLLRASKKGKLKRHQKEALKSISDKHHAKGQQKYKEFIDDYEHAINHTRKEDLAEFEEMETELIGKKKKNIEVNKDNHNDDEEMSTDVDEIESDSEDDVEVKEEIKSEDEEEMDDDSEIETLSDFEDEIKDELLSSDDENVEIIEDDEDEEAEDDDENDIDVDLLDDDEEYINNHYVNINNVTETDDNYEDGGLRHFKNYLAKDEELMLPIKVDGKIVQRVKKVEPKEEEQESEEKEKTKIRKQEQEDVSGLSAVELVAKRREMLDNTKHSIASLCLALTSDPQQNIVNVKTLIDMIEGKRIHDLIKSSVKKLVLASLGKVFADIAPGYSIRNRTETELKQKMQKTTKALVNFETTLLANYLKFLQILEKDVRYFTDNKKKFDEDCDRFKFGLIAGKVIGQLAVKLPHFNYATNVLSCLIKISTCNYQPLVKDACKSLSLVLKEDVDYRLSLHVTKNIANLCSKKNTVLNVDIMSTFLSLNVKEVDKGQHKKEKKALEIRKAQIMKEKKSKSEAKFKHQMRQMEHDLKKLEAAESLSTKLKYATETMKQLFLIYFRIIKRLPTTKLLNPVLAGLSKFAHLINIEFFDDLITSLEGLLEMKHLSVMNALNCVRTVFVILSGEGVALNIDPFKFYKCIFGFIPAIPFEKDEKTRIEEIKALIDCMYLMLVKRKKQVSIARVAAFVKRLLAISLMLPVRECIAIVSCLRTLFLTYNGLSGLIEVEEEIVMNGIYHPDVADPDTCNALASTAIKDFQMLSKYRYHIVVQYADNIINGCPSSGNKRLKAEWISMLPQDWLETDIIKNNTPSPFVEQLFKVAHKKKETLCSKNLCSTVEFWLNNSSS